MTIRVIADGADGYRLLSPANDVLGPSLPGVATTRFTRVLLAIDFGSASLAAARWATTHLAPGADALLVHVISGVASPQHGEALGQDRDAMLEVSPALTGGLAGFAATLDVTHSRTIVSAGSPSACLAAAANGAETSLLVLGRRADAKRNRVGEPNVIERTARRSGASVLVVPEGTHDAPDHVVAAVDDSRFASRVLQVAGRFARMHELPLMVLHVMSPVIGAYERVIRSAKYALGRTRAGKARRAEDRGVVHSPIGTPRWLAEVSRDHAASPRVTTEVTMGDPAGQIVRAAMERGASLVVVGTRGADDAPPGSLGSISRELLTRAPMPVLAVNGI